MNALNSSKVGVGMAVAAVTRGRRPHAYVVYETTVAREPGEPRRLSPLPASLVLRRSLEAHFSVLVLVLRSDVLVSRKMSRLVLVVFLYFFFLLKFQNIRPELVVHTPFFTVILFTDERSISIAVCNFSAHSLHMK